MSLRGLDSPGLASTDPALWGAFATDLLGRMLIEAPAAGVVMQSITGARVDATSRA